MNPIQVFLQDIDFDKLPESVQKQAIRCLYDLTATAAAGSQTRLSAIIHHHVQQQFAAPAQGPCARPLLGGEPVSVSGAALAGAATIAAMDAHAGHRLTKGHVGCALLPALAAVLDRKRRVSGTSGSGRVD